MLKVLAYLDIPTSTWYRRPVADPKPRGRPPQPLDPTQVAEIQRLCRYALRLGYKRMAVVARRWLDRTVYTSNLVYRIMKQHGLLQTRKPRPAEPRQTMRLFELLPQRPNELWQMDVTYLNLGRRWSYAVTVIDYCSRYLLVCCLTPKSACASGD